MLIFLRKTISLHIVAVCCIILAVTASSAAGQSTTGWLDDRVTLRFQDEAMNEVLGKISQQTGIAILYDENLAGEKVTGNYKNIKFSEAINRLFSEKNKSIQVFKNEKKIVVKTFGAKQFILASSGETSAVQTRDEDMIAAELEKMHRQQYKERIVADNELFEGGVTRGEIRKMHEQQEKQYRERLADDTKEFEGGVTRGEIRKMHEKQKEMYKKKQEDESRYIAPAQIQ